MFKPIFAAAAAIAVATTSFAMPAAAQDYYGMPSYGQQDSRWQDRGQSDGFETVGYRQDRRYRNNNRRYYNNNRRYSNNRSGRCYDKGNGGLAIGGIAGALAGRTIAGGGDKTLGTILGAGAGALAGRAIDKSDGRPC